MSEPGNLKRQDEKLKQLHIQLQTSMQPVIKASQAIGQAALGTGQVISNAFYQAYLKCGAPYGENQEGFLRWLTEMAKQSPDDEIELASAVIEVVKYRPQPPSPSPAPQSSPPPSA